MRSKQKFIKKIMKIYDNLKSVHLEMCTKINLARRGEKFYSLYSFLHSLYKVKAEAF